MSIRVKDLAGITGPVLIIGTGLLGTSLGLALTAKGANVQLRDTSPTSLALARDMGAGQVSVPGLPEPNLVLVCAPPDVAAECICASLNEFPDAWVSDVASVKAEILAQVRALSPTNVWRYVGSHPMAGRERSGAGAAHSDIFAGRPWVVVPHEESDPQAVLTLRTLAVDVGSYPLELCAKTHDEAVALVSHAPQLVSSLLAARLADAPIEALGLAGQGLRDTTRIAASDPRLWTAIIAGNSGPVADILQTLCEDLSALVAALRAGQGEGPLSPGSVGQVNSVMRRGNAGVSRIPGKHGGAPRRYGEVSVIMPDKPGEMGRLFSEVGQVNVNIEDLAMEHSAGQRVGLVRLKVLPSVVSHLETELAKRGWRTITD